MNFDDKILVSITGHTNKDWEKKFKEIEKLKLTKVALFLERFKAGQRKKLYKALLNSRIKEIPLVHIRHDMSKDELKFLADTYNSKYLTIHEQCFDILQKWRGYYKKLYLEMNNDDFISKKVDLSKIGGFCIDVSHFKKAEERWVKEYEFVMNKRKRKDLFVCNHLSGYSYRKNTDLHTARKNNDFDYLRTLPKFIFGKCVAIEIDNPIRQQLKFKKHIVKLLNKPKRKYRRTTY